MTKVASKTFVLLFLQQTFMINGQILSGRPPLLYQFLFSGLNSNAQQPQQQPQIPLLNFLQYLRPTTLNVPTNTQSDTPPVNTQPVPNGVIPFLLNNLLQNIRQPPVGTAGTVNTGTSQPTQPTTPTAPGAVGIVPLLFQQLLQSIRLPSGAQNNTSDLGVSSDEIINVANTTLPQNVNNINQNTPNWTPENIAALQQLLQGGNIPLLLGLTQLPIPGVSPTQVLNSGQIPISTGVSNNIPSLQTLTLGQIPTSQGVGVNIPPLQTLTNGQIPISPGVGVNIPTLQALTPGQISALSGAGVNIPSLQTLTPGQIPISPGVGVNIPTLQTLTPGQISTLQGLGANIPTLQTQNPNFIFDNNLLSILSTRPSSEPFKPVTEISNDVSKPAQSPFVSLSPVLPLQPQNPSMISYVPFTTTVKPFITNDGSTSVDQTRPQSFNLPPIGTPRPTVTRPTERSTTFIPLFFERIDTSPALSSNRKNPTATKETAIEIGASTQNAKLSSKFITSSAPVESIIPEEKIVTSQTLIFNNNKKKESEVATLLHENSEIKPNFDNQKISLPDKKVITENTEINNSQLLESQNQIKLKDEDNVTDLNEKQTTKVPETFIQSDELPNELIPHNNDINENKIGTSAFANYPIMVGPQGQGVISQGPIMNYPINVGFPNQYPIRLVNRGPDGNIYENVPHFAYTSPYSGWVYYCPPQYFRNYIPLQLQQPYEEY